MFSNKRTELSEVEPVAPVDDGRRSNPPVIGSRQLSRRETDVLRWLACGKRGAEIATLLGISVCTVRVHVRHITKKLNASNIPHAIALAFQLGILPVQGY
ncbi:MAG: helix-turn-helix transcriptional regulator [Sulfurifustis sp.]